MSEQEKPDFSKFPVVEVVNAEEKWNTYLLEDGNVLRVKVTLIKVLKTDKIDEENHPVYVFRHQFLTDIRPPTITAK